MVSRADHDELLDEDRASPAAKEATAFIRGAILADEARLRAAHPLLAHRDAIALAIWTLALGARVTLAALYLGGAGAIFWMWMVALVGMATAYAEATLAQLYKTRGPGGL